MTDLFIINVWSTKLGVLLPPVPFLLASSHSMVLLFCNQSSFMSHANASIHTAELPFAISTSLPSGEALKWSGQGSETHRAEQAHGEIMQKAGIVMLWGKRSFVHIPSWVPYLNSPIQPSSGLCSPPFAFPFKGEFWFVGFVQERKDFNSYSTSDPLALAWLAAC